MCLIGAQKSEGIHSIEQHQQSGKCMDDNYISEQRLKTLVIATVVSLRNGSSKADILCRLEKQLIHRDSARAVLEKAQELFRSGNPLPITLGEHSSQWDRAIELWGQGCRPLGRCLDEAGIDEAERRELDEQRIGWGRMRQASEQKLLDAGLPPSLASSEVPQQLLDLSSLTHAQRNGLRHLAATVHIGKMHGLTEPEIAVRLANVHELDLVATRQFVSLVGLHIRPELAGVREHEGKGATIMASALGAGFVVALAAKTLAQVSHSTAGLVFAGVAFVAFPFVRSALSRKAIAFRREHAPNGLVALAKDSRKPVLYLRSHVVDGSETDSDGYFAHLFQSTEMRTLEERLSAVLSSQGPVVALEGPSEGLPNLGARRIRIYDVKQDQWQNFVLGLILRSQLVVMYFIPTEGVRWEVRQLLRFCPPHQLVFVLTTPDSDLGKRDRSWSELRSMLNGWVANDLPQSLGPDHYCLGFDPERKARLFGKRSILFGKRSAFFDALVAAADFENPFFDKASAEKLAIMNSN